MKYLKTYENIMENIIDGDYIMTLNYEQPVRIAFMPDKGDINIVCVPHNKEFKVKNSIEIPIKNIIRKLTTEEIELFLTTNKYNI